ncbi:hypothetical protein NESM_000174700 [Novymonas esmeraldas]|uniref:Actin-like protein n=1 Tax=Novymonas esmeraldas TaxID=1808958 RepID=A0AAW0F7V2_9TRYP
MSAGEPVCFIDAGHTVVTITVLAAADTQQWQIDVPRDAAHAMADTVGLLAGGARSAALDRLLFSAAKTARLATMAGVVLLSRSWVQPLLYTYMTRWLRAALPESTAVSVLPRACYATRCAGVRSALVVQCDDGVLRSVPVLDGVVADELDVVWGDVQRLTSPTSPCLRDWFCRAGAGVCALLRQPAQEALSPPPPPPRTPDKTSPTSAALDLLCAADLLSAVEEQVAACRKRELRACLATIVLCGTAAATPSVRSCVAVLLSEQLPSSVLTWV